MKKFNLTAMGGTFDIIHEGHLKLLSSAFAISRDVIIGLTSDEFAKKKGKNTVYSYLERYKILENTIKEQFPNSKYQIKKLDNDFGPAVLEEKVQALIVSEETSYQGEILNKMRKEKNLLPVEIVVVPMVLAADNQKISTTRIKNSEIDSHGNLL